MVLMCRSNSRGAGGLGAYSLGILFDPRMSRGAFWRIFGTNNNVS